MAKINQPDPFAVPLRSSEPSDAEVDELEEELAEYRTKTLSTDISWYGRPTKNGYVQNSFVPFVQCHWSVVQYALDKNIISRKGDGDWRIVAYVIGRDKKGLEMLRIEWDKFRKKCRIIEKRKDARLFAQKAAGEAVARYETPLEMFPDLPVISEENHE